MNADKHRLHPQVSTVAGATSLHPSVSIRAFHYFFATACWAVASTAFAESTNAAALAPPELPNVGASLLRVLGALALVIALFLGGVWLIRNWQRFAARRGGVPRLNVLEVRSLGGRHAIYVVGYEQERFLVASSPGGVNLLSHLPPSDGEAAPSEPVTPAMSFPQTLARVLKGQ